MAGRKREEVISVLSTFALLLVIFRHSFPWLEPNHANSAIRFFVRMHYFVDSLPIYIFVFISGYLFILTTPAEKEIKYFSFIFKKTKRLLLPYLVLSTLAYPLKCLLSRFAFRPIDFSIITYAKTLVYPSENTIFFFWFLPTLFGVYLVAPVLHKIFHDRRKSFLVPGLSILLTMLFLFNPARNVLLFNFGGICDFLLFFWMGMLYFLVKDVRIPLRSAIAVICFGLLVALNINRINSTLESLFAIIFCLFSIHQLAAVYVERKIKIFDFLDGFSYPIYLLSWFPQVLFRILSDQVLGLNFFISFVILYSSGLFVSLAMAKLILRYLPRAKSVIGM